jgi:SAM-dependent methyltransferase
MFRQGVNYFTNLTTRVVEQEGYLTAAKVGSSFLLSEASKLPRLARLKLSERQSATSEQTRIELEGDWTQLSAVLATRDIELKEYYIDPQAFRAHIDQVNYPRNYAGGPRSEGGAREEKLLEYFVSLDLMDIQATDVVIDVASEWSVFPDFVHELTGATVYRQDLIYPPGIKDNRIGGSAACMPVANGFADKLVLHNAFEHFEGTADTEFILEAWRVLKPGGILCILPLFMAQAFVNLTDPLVQRAGITWDPGARVIERLWWRNRFARYYDVEALWQRVLRPAHEVGFRITILHVENLQETEIPAYLCFVLVMVKP